MPKFNIIVSVNRDNVIGYENNLLIESSHDLKYFYKITSRQCNKYKNVCIMGWNTWESIPKNVRPLKNRINIILTQNHCVKETDDVLTMSSLDMALEWCNINDIGKVFIIGGQSIYAECFMNMKNEH